MHSLCYYRNRNERRQRELHKLANARAAKARKRLDNPPEHEPKMKRFHPLELGVRQSGKPESAVWHPLKSVRDASKRLAVVLKYCSLIPLLCSCAHTTIEHGVPNVAWVEPGLMRGGQPGAEGWAWLRSLGITNIIKLNTGKPDAVAKDMTVLWLPMTVVDQNIGKPLACYVDFAAESIKPGTFVHCDHGQDRTGLVVGAYRVRVEHWSKDQAWAEMKQHGFHPMLRGLMWSWEEDVK